MLKSIFYARFHPERGPDILYQYPTGSVSRTSTSAGLSSSISSGTGLSLLPFSSISAYVIPPHELSNRSLAICAQGFRVLGFPISIQGEGYERNRFVFNVCFVVEESEEAGCWDGVVRKMAGFMRCLEVEGEGGLLSREERDVDERAVRGEKEQEGLIGMVLREVFEQVNAYAECCVWVSATQVLNLRLEKSGNRETARIGKVRAWDVPLLVRALPDQEGWTWDLVLEKVQPFVDGVNNVKRIARLADVDLKLVKKAIRELVLHERVMLLDIFHFQAVYALTGDFVLFTRNTDVIDECRDYVAIDPKKGMFASILDKQTIDDTTEKPDRATLLELYSILKPGMSVADFCLAHQIQLANIDVRRFITFGVIKGFLRRMHKYALALDPPDLQAVPQSNDTDLDKAWRKAALSSGWATPPVDAVTLQEKLLSEEEQARQEAAKLVKYLDGKHCLDQVCLEMGMHEKQVLGKVKSGKFGEVVVFCR